MSHDSANAELEEDMANKPDVELDCEDERTYAERTRGGNGTLGCALREPSPFARRTGGAEFCFCPCGRMLPAVPLPHAESALAVA